MSDETAEHAEEMAAFFDTRAAGYDAHMRGYVYDETTFARFYETLASPIPRTTEPIQILDLGCGTGLEIEALLRRAPNARITGIDLASEMLALLEKRYAAQMDQITLVADSYLTADLGERTYDFVVSAMTIHHLLHDAKIGLYRRIRAALKPGGKYIEGDAVTTVELEEQFLAEYWEQMALMSDAEPGAYHIDVPFSLTTQEFLLEKAGFQDFQLLWQRDPSDMWNSAVYSVTK